MGSQNEKNGNSTPMLSFYKDKSVFITGATGFLGAVILEKLLFSTQLKRAYVLITPKKGSSEQERLQNMFEKECFRRIKETQPDVLKKVVAVAGNIVVENLGLSEEDRDMLQKEVNIVIHSAASVDFSQSLEPLMMLNVRGANSMFQFATTIQKLQAFVYVSTAYSNAHENNDIVEEKICDLPMSVESALYAIESKSPLIEHMADRWHNKYMFTKAVTEKMIETRFSHLPIAIVRPSIIISAVKEPMPGWVEGWNSANPVVMLGGRLMYVWPGDPSCVVDTIPVDYTAHCVLAVAWDCSKRRLINGESDVKVFNCCSGVRNPLTMHELFSLSVSYNKIHYEKNFLPFFCIVTKRQPILWVMFFLLQTLPAFIIEALHFIMGRKSRSMKIHKRIKKMIEYLSYFSLNQFIFIDRNVKNLFDSMNEKDKTLFPFDVEVVDWKQHWWNYSLGLKKYVLKMK